MEAEALLLLLLRRRANRALNKRRISVAKKADLLFRGIRSAIIEVRELAAELSFQRTQEQLALSGIKILDEPDLVLKATRERTEISADRAAHGTTNRWLADQLDETGKFNAVNEIERVAASETVDVYSDARGAVIATLPIAVQRELHKTWQAVGDKRTCPTCDALDGETVPVKEEFSKGPPPVHGRCRCSYYVHRGLLG